MLLAWMSIWYSPAMIPHAEYPTESAANPDIDITGVDVAFFTGRET